MLLTEIFMGNAYSTQPLMEINSNLSKLEGAIRVLASAGVSTQLVYGQVRRRDLTQNNQAFNHLYNFLAQVKTKAEKQSSYSQVD